MLAVFSNTSDQTQTGRFQPAGAWTLEYSWNCKREQSEGISGAQGLSVAVYNSDDDSLAAEHPQLSSGRSVGNGVLHFMRSGDYYISMQTQCDWNVSIVNAT